MNSKLSQIEVTEIVAAARAKDAIPDLHGADLAGIDLRKMDLSRSDLSEANLGGTDLRQANLTKTNLSRAYLSEAYLSDTHLGKANLSDANLVAANLTRANLSEVDLRRANLLEANLGETNFFKAKLSWTKLEGVYLRAANFYYANLSKADISRAFMDEADLTEAKMGYTTISDTNLSIVKGLHTIKHIGPSYIDIHTLQRSGGRIPEIFLKGIGASDTFVTYIPSIAGEVIQYYSCFISFSSQDEAFTQRLHADLQQQGVRCWFAPEDMKIGDQIRPTIDRSIRIHDKLLVILSENSMRSDWVEDEAETAIEEEKKRGETVLFPIRLDESVMDTDQAWAAKLRRTRHIGDFSRWKDHDAYQQAFERLLRDLKAEG